MSRRKLMVLVAVAVIVYPALVTSAVRDKARGIVDGARKLVPL